MINNFLVLRDYYSFLRSSKWSQNKIDDYQDDMLVRLIKHSARHVPYYRDLFQQIGLDADSFKGRIDMERIPLLDKDTVRLRYADFIADNSNRLGMIHETTSGSTGTPLKLVLDNRTGIKQTACILRSYSWAGYKLFMKSFGIQSYLKDAKDPDKGLSYCIGRNVFRFDSNHLDKKHAVIIAKQLNSVKPRFYYGYPLALTMLGLFAREEGISMHSPNSIMVYGETLSHQRKALLEELYRSRIFNFYSMHERSAVISTCDKAYHHLMDDFAYNEVVDDEGMLISDGVGELVGTNLFNYSMPLIRYKTRDIVELESQQSVCDCGSNFRRVRQIIGRQNDYILTPDGKVIGNVMEHAIDGAKGIVLSQCVQDKLNSLYVNLVIDDTYDAGSLDSVMRALRVRLGNQMDIDFRIVNELEKSCGENSICSFQNWELVQMNTNVLKLNIVGDVCLMNITAHNYVFSDKVKDILSDGDINIANLECALTYSEDKLKYQPIHLKGSPELNEVIESFNVFSIANNHIMDYKQKGLVDTMDFLLRSRKFFFGAGLNAVRALEPLLLEYNGIKVALFAFTRFSNATKKTAGTAPEKFGYLCSSIRKAKSNNYFVIVYPHWNYQWIDYPAPDERKKGHRMIDAGADLVVGAHPHIIQGVELYKGKYIYHSLGNFIFRNTKYSKSIPQFGQSIILSISVDSNHNYVTKVIPVYNDNDGVRLLSFSDAEKVLNKVEFLSSKLSNSKEANALFYKSSSLVEAHNRIVFNELGKEGGLPAILSAYKVANFQDLKRKMCSILGLYRSG